MTGRIFFFLYLLEKVKKKILFRSVRKKNSIIFSIIFGKNSLSVGKIIDFFSACYIYSCVEL